MKKLLKKKKMSVIRETKNPDTNELKGDEANVDLKIRELGPTPSTISLGKTVLLPGSEIGVNRYGSVKLSVHITDYCEYEDKEKTKKAISLEVDEQLSEEAEHVQTLWEEIVEKANK
jgi:hypothetical protein